MAQTKRFKAYVVLIKDGYGYHNTPEVSKELTCYALDLQEAIVYLTRAAKDLYNPEFQSDYPKITVPEEY
jgi:hypothetical protein